MDIKKNTCSWNKLKIIEKATQRVGPRLRGLCVASRRFVMINKDIDLEKIKTLLQSVPDCINVDCIDLSENTYKLKLTKNLELSSSEQYDASLSELLELLDVFESGNVLRKEE